MAVAVKVPQLPKVGVEPYGRHGDGVPATVTSTAPSMALTAVSARGAVTPAAGPGATQVTRLMPGAVVRSAIKAGA